MAISLSPKYGVSLDASEAGAHWYLVSSGGHEMLKLPGVTTALGIIDKPALVPWARNTACDTVLAQLATQAGELVSREWVEAAVAVARKRPDKIKDDAAALGTLVHSWLDRFVRGEGVSPMDMPVACRPAVAAFISWWEKQEMEFVMGDTKVASVADGYGGSLDAVARRKNGSIVLLDWKTSNRTYDTHALQLGAYYNALAETYELVAGEGWVVRFSKVAPVTFQAKQVADLDRSYGAFKLALQLHRALRDPHFVQVKKNKETKCLNP